jgi:hypothetical protein
MAKAKEPSTKDANSAPNAATTYKHASTVGLPMRSSRPLNGDPEAAENLKHNIPPPINVARDNKSQPAALTFDPRTEIQSVPASGFPYRNSRNGKADVVEAERGTGDGL